MSLFGESTPGAGHYDWQLAPNAGGAPTLGNPDAKGASCISNTKRLAIGSEGSVS